MLRVALRTVGALALRDGDRVVIAGAQGTGGGRSGGGGGGGRQGGGQGGGSN